MQTKQRHRKRWLALPVFVGLTTFADAQSSPAQKPAQDSDSTRYSQGRDMNREEVARFDQFLDSHREIAEQLRKNPSLVNDRQFVKNHPALQSYLQDHPQTRQALRNDPAVFLNDETRFEHGEDRDTKQRDLAGLDRFLDSHRQIAEPLRRDPSLIDNAQYLKDHPELQVYLQDHPQLREQIKNNPDAFMRTGDRYDRREDNHDLDRGLERDRGELASFDQFLDSHREIGEQLRKNPALADHQQFLKDHPVLQTYLAGHPAVRRQLQRDPQAFMQQEAVYDRREDDGNHGATAERSNIGRNDDNRNRNNGNGRDRSDDFDRDRDAHRHFGEFLASHGDIGRQLSEDPSAVKRQEYLHNHPDLEGYLKQHPDVRQPLMADPQNFVYRSTQQANGTQPIKNTTTTTPPTAPTGAPKPNTQ